MASEQGADGGAEHGPGGPAAARVDLAPDQGAGRSADDQAGRAVGLAAIGASVGPAPGAAVIAVGAARAVPVGIAGVVGESRRRQDRHGEGRGRQGQDDLTHGYSPYSYERRVSRVA